MKNGKTKKITACILAAVLLATAPVPIVYQQKGNLKKTALPQDFAATLAAAGGTQKTDGATVRVMSANVLVGYKSWGGTPVKPRAAQFLEVLRQYAPDVVGLQEACADWHACLKQNAAEYAFVHPQNNLFQKSLTTMLYNTKTLRLLDSGRETYTEGDGTKHRAITWAVFETLASGERFSVTSTHLDLIREGKENAEYQIMSGQVDEFFVLIDRLQTKYDCPVFCTGDYNAMENDSINGVFAADGIYAKLNMRLADAKFQAAQQFAGEAEAWEYPSWDHIFYEGDAEILSFCVLSLPVLSEMSDHYPIFADIALT
ncbi:MAG: endonuclease/exonuclease/phosphatase family protein [Candidatus Fimenecus sp.]